MMYLDAPPRLIATEVFSAMPDHFRRKGARTDWADANRPDQPTDCFIEDPSFDAEGHLYIVDIPSCTNVAIGGANRDRLYITESTTGMVLVADIGVLDSSLRGA
jgi:hypothetical protein